VFAKYEAFEFMAIPCIHHLNVIIPLSLISAADKCSSKNVSLNAYHANHNHDLVIMVIIQHRESRSR